METDLAEGVAVTLEKHDAGDNEPSVEAEPTVEAEAAPTVEAEAETEGAENTWQDGDTWEGDAWEDDAWEDGDPEHGDDWWSDATSEWWSSEEWWGGEQIDRSAFSCAVATWGGWLAVKLRHVFKSEPEGHQLSSGIRAFCSEVAVSGGWPGFTPSRHMRSFDREACLCRSQVARLRLPWRSTTALLEHPSSMGGVAPRSTIVPQKTASATEAASRVIFLLGSTVAAVAAARTSKICSAQSPCGGGLHHHKHKGWRGWVLPGGAGAICDTRLGRPIGRRPTETLGRQKGHRGANASQHSLTQTGGGVRVKLL